MSEYTITVTPCPVAVSDDRRTVRGIRATVTSGDREWSLEAIPPEGDSIDCWLSGGADLPPAVVQELGELAREGYQQRSIVTTEDET